MEQATEAVTGETIQNGYTGIWAFADSIFTRLNAWGYVASFIIAMVLWAIFHNKSFVTFWKWVGSGIREIASSSATNALYKEQIEQLKAAQAQERIDCDRKMDEMRKDYERKITELENRMESFRSDLMANASEIATLRVMLDRYESHFTKRTADKTRRKIDDGE